MKKLLALMSVPFIASAYINMNQCYYTASNYYKVPVKLLYAITKVESDFEPYCININANGRSIGSRCYNDYQSAYYVATRLFNSGYNIDIGLMQINSENIKDHHWNLANVLNPCLNVFYGAYLLRQNINRYGYNWTAIWHYNGAPSYAHKVYKALLSLGYGTPRFTAYKYNYSMNIPNATYYHVISVFNAAQTNSQNLVKPQTQTINNGVFTVISDEG
jgi:soluble lytic murein transglycosylase-like protein